MGAMPSPITGQSGNVEFLLHARTPGPHRRVRRRPTLGRPARRGRRRGPRRPDPGRGLTVARIAFYTHPDRPEAAALADRADRLAGRRGATGRSPPCRPTARSTSTAPICWSAWAATARCCGRWTAPSSRPVPVLGVNLGLLGYLTQVEPAGLERRPRAVPRRQLPGRGADDAGGRRRRSRRHRGDPSWAPSTRRRWRRPCPATPSGSPRPSTAALRHLCGRRAVGGHAHRVDRLQPLGPGTAAVAPAAGHRRHPGLTPHALRPPSGARPGPARSGSTCWSPARPCWWSTGSPWPPSNPAPPSTAGRATDRPAWSPSDHGTSTPSCGRSSTWPTGRGPMGRMLVELHVRDLGVIDDVTVALGPG